jgi:hypothetical protein
MAATNAERKQAYRAKLESMDLAQESVYVHNEDKQALRIYAAQLRKARGCSLPTDSKILENLPVQTASIDSTIAQTKIDRVVTVVESFEAKGYQESSPRWAKGFELLTAIKKAIK